MKLLLILPHGPIHRAGTGTYKRALRYAPLTLATLVALVPLDLNFDVHIIDEGVDAWDPKEFTDYDLVAISAMTGTAVRAYAMADFFRRHNITVVMGGIHPTLMPQEAKAHADCVITGLAEETWPQALRDFTQRQLKPFYHMPSNLNLASFYTPVPDRSIFDHTKYITVNSIEATRGCAFKCTFCAVATAWNNRYYTRPVESVIAEISTLQGNELCFLDPSLTCNREYSLQLFRAMKPLKKWWVGCSTIDIAHDPELLAALAESGCRGLLIGFESVSPQSLAEVKKPFNDVLRYREAVRRFHSYGIGIQACFVFGLETDDRDVFKRTVDFIYESEIDLPQFSVLTPFPGTGIYKELASQNRIIENNWALFDAEHVVFRPKNMTVDQLQEGLMYAWRKSYSLRSIFKRLSGSRCLLSISIPANLGYNHYARHLSRYTPDLMHHEQLEF
ncbi:MAG: B12-binding domain-containing radical SAM protein [Candidatus Riflebacteria bacterium]|nr:B12-binding domain-containing radical SAM protein [Candidatus Riflebacteria bacterium]